MIYINNKHVECQMFKYTDRWIEPCCHNLWGFLPSNCVSRGKKTVFSRQDRKRVSNRVFHKNTFSKKNKRNPLRISLGVGLKESKRIFHFDKV